MSPESLPPANMARRARGAGAGAWGARRGWGAGAGASGPGEVT